MKIVCALDMHFSHHLDHLVPLCELLDATLLLFTDEDEKILLQYYPPISYEKIPEGHILYEFLSSCDLIISTSKSGKNLSEQTKLMTGRTVPYVFLPHGQSDKAFSAHDMAHYVPYRFVYGQYMIDQLEAQGVTPRKTFTLGNYRYKYYLKHRQFFDALVPEMDQRKATLLYAPTWNDEENSSSMRQALDFFEELTEAYHVILKLHPFSERYQPGYYYALEERAHCTSGCTIANAIPFVYPFLSKTDLYLGDYSSIGYDFLAFDKPLFFLQPQNEQKNEAGKTLQKCGTIVENIKSISTTKDTFSLERKKRYEYTFGKEENNLVSLLSQCTEAQVV